MEAVRWFRRAAERGYYDAQYYLGTMYTDGRGVLQDAVTAHMWLNLAAAQYSGSLGDLYVRARDRVAARLTPEQRAEAQRLAREWRPIDQR